MRLILYILRFILEGVWLKTQYMLIDWLLFASIWRNMSRLKTICWYSAGKCDIVFIFYINRERARGNSVMLRLFHWYYHRAFGYGKMMTFTLKIFNIYGDVYTRYGAILLCQRDASAQVVMSHNHSTQVLDPFCSPPPWSPKTWSSQTYIMCLIWWALIALDTAVRL